MTNDLPIFIRGTRQIYKVYNCVSIHRFFLRVFLENRISQYIGLKNPVSKLSTRLSFPISIRPFLSIYLPLSVHPSLYIFPHFQSIHKQKSCVSEGNLTISLSISDKCGHTRANAHVQPDNHTKLTQQCRIHMSSFRVLVCLWGVY